MSEEKRLSISDAIFGNDRSMGFDRDLGGLSVEKEGLRIARSRRKHGRTYVFDHFFLTGHSSLHAGGKVVLVTEESRGRHLITPPADILYTRTWRRKNRRATFVYYEHPDLRRIKLGCS